MVELKTTHKITFILIVIVLILIISSISIGLKNYKEKVIYDNKLGISNVISCEIDCPEGDNETFEMECANHCLKILSSHLETSKVAFWGKTYRLFNKNSPGVFNDEEVRKEIDPLIKEYSICFNEPKNKSFEEKVDCLENMHSGMIPYLFN
jgi:hypothetical protein